MKARKGDIAVVEYQSRYMSLRDSGDNENTSYEIGEVTKTDRAGIIKEVRTVHNMTRKASDHGVKRILFQGADTVDVPKALDAARKHTYAGHSQVQPFDTLAEAVDTIRPFKR